MMTMMLVQVPRGHAPLSWKKLYFRVCKQNKQVAVSEGRGATTLRGRVPIADQPSAVRQLLIWTNEVLTMVVLSILQICSYASHSIKIQYVNGLD